MKGSFLVILGLAARYCALARPAYATEHNQLETLSDQCNLVLDAIFVVDATDNPFDGEANFKRELPLMGDLLISNFPSSRLAMATFRDKPVPPLGFRSTEEGSDYCIRVQQNFANTAEAFALAASQLSLGNGGDVSDSQLDALIRVAVSKAFSWRSQSDVGEDQTFAKLVVLHTDSPPHMEGAAAAAAEAYNANLPDGSPKIDIEDNVSLADYGATLSVIENFRCDSIDYPSLTSVGPALNEGDKRVIFMLAPCEEKAEDGTVIVCSALTHLYEATQDPTYLDATEGLVKIYEDLAKVLNIKALVVPVTRGHYDLASQTEASLDQIREFLCDDVDDPAPSDTGCKIGINVRIALTARSATETAT